MKLHRFVAANDHKAMFLVNQALGDDALIYSIKSTSNGVEVVASLPEDKPKENSSEYLNSYQQVLNDVDGKVAESKSDEALREMQSRLDMLTNQLNVLSGSLISNHEESKKESKNEGYFKRLFRKPEKRPVKPLAIDYGKLTKAIKKLNLPTKHELIESKKIIGLVGPAGVGKTTTILKLARRHINRYGASSLGVITTDYHEITERNLISGYKHRFNFDLEYASNAIDLSVAIKNMADKKLILIDTHGISQRNKEKVNELAYLFETQANNVASYYVLPCNAQEVVLNDVIKSYQTKTTQGCIITKQDECATLQPVINVLSQHDLRVEYVCNGQDINTNIFIPTVEKLVGVSMNMSEI